MRQLEPGCGESNRPCMVLQFLRRVNGERGPIEAGRFRHDLVGERARAYDLAGFVDNLDPAAAETTGRRALGADFDFEHRTAHYRRRRVPYREAGRVRDGRDGE